MILGINDICNKMNPELTTFIHNIIILIKIAIPVILIIFGMIDLGKGVVAGKEDEIKKGQNDFIKRLIAGVIVFFMVSIVQLVISLIDKDSNGEFWNCANKILNGKTTISETKHVKTEEERQDTIEKCCNKVNGTLTTSKNSKGEENKSCMLPNQEAENEYNKCFEE